MQLIDIEENKTQGKIRQFIKLPIGWHFGEGVPPNEKTEQSALNMADRMALSGFRTDAFPGIDGEIMVTGYHNENYIEFTFEADGTVTFIREEGDEEIEYAENLTVREAKEHLKTFRDEIWKKSYELSAQDTTTHERNSLRASLSEILQALEFQSFSSPALMIRRRASAPIFENFTKESPQTLSFFGQSIEGIYQTDVSSTNMIVIPVMYATET